MLQKDRGTELARLEAFSIVIEKYEDEHYPIAAPDPIEAIKFRMEQAELRQEDLVPCIGSLSMVSEILEGKQPLTTEMAMALGKTFGIPIDIVGSTQTTEDGHWKVSE